MTTNEPQPSRMLVDISQPKSKASSLRSRLGAIDLQIAALESHLALLHAEREEVLKDLAQVVYPILTLPTDIASEIFTHYVEKPLSRHYAEPTNNPLHLTSICRLWRATALSTCRLWTQLNFGHADTHHPTGYDRVSYAAVDVANRLRWWLPRAGSLPVDLHIRLPTSPTLESDGIIRAVAQYSTRWGLLEITSNGPITFPADIRGPFSALTKLSLKAHPSADGLTTLFGLLDAPRLREIETCAIQLTNWRTSLPLDQLTKLDLKFSDAAECLGILAHTPNLEVLSYRSLVDTTEPSSLCILQCLRSLRVDAESSPEILPYLVVPALERLRLSAECADYSGPLITRSGCSPRILELFVEDSDFGHADACMRNLSTIRELTLTCDDPTYDFNRLLTTLAEGVTFLPALESLNIDECKTNVDVILLEGMLSARTTGEIGSKLTSFRIRFSDEISYRGNKEFCRDMQVELALDRLRKLRSQGLSLEFLSSVKWFSVDMNSQMIRETAGS
ncbi:hypothetical protein C8R43DRAFT_998251 [Mycena crocata]|nr:hypothetical protein C8R43DRAFT_998251 [Mycena crocata]